MDLNKIYKTWVEKAKEDADIVSELKKIEGNDQEIYESFYRTLDFGTAGIRGVLGAGTNRMNIYIVRLATQALSDYLNSQKDNCSVAIAYDSRIKSDLFAQEAASVFAGNNIKVHLYRELMPTPMLSYAIRALSCDSGIIVTASHNPAKYNGYKAYDNTGCQIGPDIADKVKENMLNSDIFDDIKYCDFKAGLESGIIEYISDELIESYYQKVLEQSIRPGIAEGSELKLVYTPLNGAGNKPVKEILNRIGIQNVIVVPEQENPDGTFRTCPYPNPEIREALDLGIKLCLKENADMLLATDPDADRVGIAVKNGDDLELISGNEMGVMLLDYICKSRIEKNLIPKNPVAVRSIVSTALANKVAENYGVELREVLTGFKFIGEQIYNLEKANQVERFILGFEESYGYLVGSYARDKDAVVASMLIVEMASYYKTQGKSLVQVRDEIYQKYGYYLHKVDSLTFEGSSGMEKMDNIMQSLRDKPIKNIAGIKIIKYKDYNLSKEVDRNGEEKDINLPKSNVLSYELENGDSFIIRPSGTEPKIKTYYTVIGANKEESLIKYNELSKEISKVFE